MLFKITFSNSHVSSLTAKAAIIPMALCGALAALTVTGSVRGATIFNDSFSYGTPTTPVALNGQKPDVADITGQTWSGDTTVTANGSVAYTGTPQVSESLGYSFAAGNIYTLSADILDANTTSSNWVGLAFEGIHSIPATGEFNNSTNPYSWMLVQGNVGLQAFGGNNTSDPVSISAGTSSLAAGQDNTIKIVLDMSSSNAANWTFQYFGGKAGGTLSTLGGPYSTAFTSASSIVGVGFGTSGEAASVDNFSLTDQAVPEPATLGLLGIGGLGILTLGKRRRTA